MFDMAIDEFQNAISQIEDMSEIKKEIIYNLGVAYETIGKNDLALEQYKTIFKTDVGFKDISKRIEASYQ